MSFTLAAVHSALEIIPLFLLLCIPFGRFLRLRGKNRLFIFIIFLITLALAVYNPVHYYSQRAFHSMLSMVYYSALFSFLLKFQIRQIIFVLFLAKGYLDNIILLARMFGSSMCPYPGQGFTNPHILMMEVGLFLLTLPLAGLFLFKKVRPLMENSSHMPFWKYLWMIPLSYYLIYRFGICPDYLSFSSWEVNELVISFVWVFASFLTYFFICQMLYETSNSVALQEKLHISEIQLSIQAEHYALLQKNIDELHRTQHDQRHHFLVLKSYIETRDWEGLEQYLSTFFNNIDLTVGPAYCENQAVDSVIQYYTGIAQKNGVDVTVKVSLPPSLPLPETDFCVVLGNLLENAVEACIRQKSGQRFLQLLIGTTGKNILLLSLKNSFDGKIQTDNGEFLSSKRRGKGIGTASVRQIVEHYHGTVRFEYDRNIFHTSFMLNP